MAKLYIAGKITGVEVDCCKRNFRDAAWTIERAGHTPLNPFEMVDQDEGREYEEYLLEALAIVLCMAEGLYMLPDWRDSLGARIEHAIAVEKRMPIYYAASELPIGCEWPEGGDAATA